MQDSRKNERAERLGLHKSLQMDIECKLEYIIVGSKRIDIVDIAIYLDWVEQFNASIKDK